MLWQWLHRLLYSYSDEVDVVVIIVVGLPQMPEDDLRSASCTWKVDKLVTVGGCVELVMALVGWVLAGMEVV